MGTFSLMAKRYKLYILGSTDVAPFVQSSDPTDVASFRDPDLPNTSSVYVATSPNIYNEVFLWGPRDVRSEGPDVLRNLVASNRKVPLVPLEQQIGFTPGPSSGPEAITNLAPYPLPGSRALLGFATSLPAFVYGEPAAGTDPCSDTSKYYMRCLNRLGANVVVQDEANIGGRWTGPDGNGIEQWQPLSWMASTDRAVSDPSVRFAYNIDGKGTQLINWAVEVFTKEQGPIDWNKPGRLEDFHHHFADWHFDWLDVAKLMQDSEFLLTYPMVDRDPIPRWVFGRVGLLGDAAHPMYPRGGNGGAQAILDAVAFARHLKNGGDVLKAYEEERVPLANKVVLQSRNAPPDVIIDEVERRTGGKKFKNIDDVMSKEEMRKVLEKYKQVSGSDLDSVGRAA